MQRFDVRHSGLFSDRSPKSDKKYCDWRYYVKVSSVVNFLQNKKSPNDNDKLRKYYFFEWQTRLHFKFGQFALSNYFFHTHNCVYLARNSIL